MSVFTERKVPIV